MFTVHTHTIPNAKNATNVPTNHIHEEDIKHTRCRFSQYARREEDRLKTHDTLRRKPHEYAQFPNCNVKTKVKEEKEEKKTPPITERSNPAKYDTVGHAKKKKKEIKEINLKGTDHRRGLMYRIYERIMVCSLSIMAEK